MKKEDIKELLIEWLSNEYSKSESILMINKSTINKEGDIITITYEIGVVDILKIENEKVIHLNPYED